MTLESTGSRIYINLTDKNELAVVDRLKHSVIASWPVTKGKHNIAVALDDQHHRLFVGCTNKKQAACWWALIRKPEKSYKRCRWPAGWTTSP